MLHLRNDARHWGAISKALHWSIAALMIAAMTASIWAAQLDPEIESHRALWGLLILKIHKPLGFTALLLIGVRIVWALTNPRPAMPADMRLFEKRASLQVHRLLYLLMIVVPLSGWFMSQYAGSPIDYFGLFEIGNLVDKDRERVAELHPVHVYSGLVAAVVVVLHAAAAVFHHVVRRDRVLVAMLPGRRPVEEPPA